jgi:phosphatidate cytidylyltransferase
MTGTALLLLVIFFALLCGKDVGMVWLLALGGMGAQVEFQNFLKQSGTDMLRAHTLMWTAVIILGSWYLPPLQSGVWLFAIACIAIASHCISLGQPQKIILPFVPSLLALIYVPFALQFGSLIMRSAVDSMEGLLLLLWVICICKFGDVGAFFVGTAIGRHKMLKNFSPQKTWEGFVGGMLASIGMGALLKIFALKKSLPLAMGWEHCIALSLLIGIVATMGDLFESAIKRVAHTKDSGKCIPGIGGYLDFFDSLIFALPTAHVFFTWTNIFPQ